MIGGLTRAGTGLIKGEIKIGMALNRIGSRMRVGSWNTIWNGIELWNLYSVSVGLCTPVKCGNYSNRIPFPNT